MNCKEANEISISEFLYSLGFIPTRILGNSYWYLSPIREEKTSSFKVDIKLNRWYDHGLSKGGKLVDLGVELFKISVSELLIGLSSEDIKANSFSFQKPKLIDPPSFEIKKLKELTNSALISYLEQRSIPISIAAKYCWEVYYRLNEKHYFAIAIQNDSHGFEIRNRYFKACLGAKDITTIRTDGATRVILFEGLIDFLSALKNLHFNPNDNSVIILNSVNQIEKAKLRIKELSPSHIDAFFDNDAAGANCFARLKKDFPNAVDQSALYKEYKDLNEMISNKNQSNGSL